MQSLPHARQATIPRTAPGQRGFTITEILVGFAITAAVTNTIAILVGTAVQVKMVASRQAAGTETSRATLAWMAERLRNAGLNLRPSVQSQPRCKDRMVAKDPSLLPTESRVFVSGEMQKTNTAAGDEDLTIGYYLAADPGTGNQVVMEYKQPCASGPTSISTYSARLSNPNLNVTSLTFQYFDANGMAITDLTSPTQIRTIAAITISFTVQGSGGASSIQRQSLARSVMFWNPDPNKNNWINPNENY